MWIIWAQIDINSGAIVPKILQVQSLKFRPSPPALVYGLEFQEEPEARVSNPAKQLGEKAKPLSSVKPRYCGVVILQDKLQIKLTIYKQIWAASHVPPSTPT